MVTANGGLNQQKVVVYDAVAVVQLLNVTLVIPKFMHSSVWKDVSSAHICRWKLLLAGSKLVGIYVLFWVVSRCQMDIYIKLRFFFCTCNLLTIGSKLASNYIDRQEHICSTSFNIYFVCKYMLLARLFIEQNLMYYIYN